MDPKERSFYPMVEFRDAAFWFARRGHLVVVPIRPGFGSSAIDLPDQGVFSTYFGTVGKCTDASFRTAGIAIARLNQWVIDYVVGQKLASASGTIVVGQSGGGWGALAFSSLNPAGVRAVITFEAGRGGRVDGKPNNNCNPEKLIEAAREFGEPSPSKRVCPERELSGRSSIRNSSVAVVPGAGTTVLSGSSLPNTNDGCRSI
ncbi:pimeloyl-ACP methyl ester carboxylesterase [Bradyrhizobium sp. JR4.1]|uniref:hypothetical protein n=1 Tax=unclassified Bradyrhizobium TaxID=2631580 RepID=UPI001FDA8537|nr:hypothetical protein [Bradyrhizobium sp. WSM1417]